MADVEVSIERDDIQRLIHSDEGLAELVEQVLNQLLEAEITHHLGAGRHERSPERRGRRNGHYRRSLTTRVRTIELNVPRDREGRFRTELFERYQRSEKALVLSLLEMVINGVSTRKVARITEELCGREFKRSTVSDLAKQLDVQVEAWSERPLEGVFPFLIVDAMQIKVRREAAVRPTSVLIAVAVNQEGLREIVGLRVADSESEQRWRDLFGDLKRRGLSGVEFVVSDAHGGLVSACKRAFQGVAWQRCQVALCWPSSTRCGRRAGSGWTWRPTGTGKRLRSSGRPRERQQPAKTALSISTDRPILTPWGTLLHERDEPH